MTRNIYMFVSRIMFFLRGEYFIYQLCPFDISNPTTI